MTNKIRTALAWIVGLTTLVAVSFAIPWVVKEVGIKAYEHVWSDDGYDSVLTLYGCAVAAIAIMIGWRAGTAVYSGTLAAWYSPYDNRQFCVWLAAFFTAGVIGVLLQLYMPRHMPSLLWSVIEIGICGAVWLVFSRFFGMRFGSE